MAQFDYEGATKELIRFWEKYHEDYQNLVSRYWDLIREKEDNGFVLHNSRDKAILRDFPKDISFLNLKYKSQVVDKIDNMTPGQLKRLICDIECRIVPECSCFNLLKKRVRYHERDIRDQKRPKKYVYRIKHITE